MNVEGESFTTESILAESVLLKILTGPHEGAEIPIHNGRYVVGNSFECDIVIRDTLVESQHLELLIESDQIYARPLAGKTLVNQVPLDEAGCEITYYQSLTLGGTRMMLGPVDEPWILPQEESMPAPEPVEKSRPKEPKEERENQRKHRTSRRPAILSVLLLATAVAGCVSFGVWASRNLPDKSAEPEKPAVPPHSQPKSFETSLRELPFGQNLQVEKIDNRLFITGYVPTYSDRKQLRSLVASLSPLASVRVFVSEQILSDTNLLLQDQVSQLVLATKAPGQISVTGIVATRRNWQELRTRLLADVQGLKEVNDSKVYDANEIAARVNDFLEKGGFSGKLQLISNYPSFTLVGRLNRRERDAWDNLQNRIPEVFGFPIALSSEIKQTGGTGFEGNIVENISIDELRWATLRDGRRLFEGSLLPGGYRIQKIQPDGILISKKGIPGYLVKVGEEL
jgi:type III secretion system YscD/HrpQ family protein